MATWVNVRSAAGSCEEVRQIASGEGNKMSDLTIKIIAYFVAAGFVFGMVAFIKFLIDDKYDT